MVATTEEARFERPSMGFLQGFKNFLLQGDVVIVAVGLVIALAFSGLITAFTGDVINPLVNAIQGGNLGLGFSVRGQRVDIGSLISAVINFVIFMAVIYFVIVVPYRSVQKRRGITVFGDPPPSQTCPACLSEGLPMGATKCRYCASTLGGAA
ncbi:MAG TPA: MscL family protein [Gaiellaceae bacterium]|nr:MscL family protein [Gaiellaceae bacterium]